jgi:hypothetical protein
MARFQIGDKIELLKRKQVIRKGVVINGPWNVEKVDHYHIKWEWDEDEIKWKNMECDLICDLSSEKYKYQLSN